MQGCVPQTASDMSEVLLKHYPTFLELWLEHQLSHSAHPSLSLRFDLQIYHVIQPPSHNLPSNISF